MHQQLWGYKVQEKLYVGVCKQKRLNTTDLDHLTLEDESKMFLWNVGNHSLCDASCPRILESAITTLWRIQNCILYPCCVMWLLNTLVYHTIPQFSGCALAFVQTVWDLHEGVWDRHEEIIVFLKVNGEDQMFQRQKLGNWLEFLIYSMGHSDNLNMYRYFSHIYKWYVAVTAFQTKALLFSIQIKENCCTLQTTQMSSSAASMYSHIPRKMQHHMIFSWSWSTCRMTENENISSLSSSWLWLSEWKYGELKVLRRKMFWIFASTYIQERIRN
jgi:hypothetical protein